jgi:NarL family two-component system response regulator YdfI
VIRVVVVSPLQAVRLGLRVMLSESPAGADDLPPAAIAVVYESANLGELDGILEDVDVLLLASDSLAFSELGRLVSKQEGRLSVLLLTQDPQAARQLSILPLRAWGILTIEASLEELTAAVYALNEGLLVGMPTLLKPALVRLLAGESILQAELPGVVPESLTDRENEVLQLLAMGLANKQIAGTLGISEHTVKFHVSSIYTRLNVTNRAEAVRVGIQRGLILF